MSAETEDRVIDKMLSTWDSTMCPHSADRIERDAGKNPTMFVMAALRAKDWERRNSVVSETGSSRWKESIPSTGPMGEAPNMRSPE
jgi:hypothetical protein